jgi:rubrerythrin
MWRLMLGFSVLTKSAMDDLFDPELIPDKFRGSEPRMTTLAGIEARLEYLRYYLDRTQRQRFSKAYTEKVRSDAESTGAADPWKEVADEMRFLDGRIGILRKQIREAEQAHENYHICPCCGLPTTVTPPGQVGPECRKHPERFPCRNHNKAATKRS